MKNSPFCKGENLSLDCKLQANQDISGACEINREPFKPNPFQIFSHMASIPVLAVGN